MGQQTLTLDRQSYIDVMSKLSQLGELEKQGIIQYGLKEGVTILAAEGKRNLIQRNNIRKGNLVKSIGVQVRKKDMKSYAGFTHPKGNAAHLVDRGTKARYTKKGFYRGSVKGSEFWSDAFDAKKEEAQNILIESIQKSIKRITNR